MNAVRNVPPTVNRGSLTRLKNNFMRALLSRRFCHFFSIAKL